MITLSPGALKRRILSDKYNRRIFGRGRGREVFLVGGYVRDALRGLSSPDRDFLTTGDLKAFATEIKDIIGGSLVQFKRDNMIRVALQGGVTFDFSSLAGSLREDLSRRDFTVNAIAWSPDTQIVDYYGGREDIRKNIIRAISQENMISDPLRMLRAYRFAATLSGSIQSETRKIIKTFCNRIKEVSSERITSELFDLLNSERPSKYLKMALEDGLLTKVLPISFRKLEANIRSVTEAERAISNAKTTTIKVPLDGLLSQNLTYKGLLCLETLTRHCSLQRVANALTLSNRVIKRIDWIRAGTKLWGNKNRPSPVLLFDIFRKSGEASIDLLIMKKRTDLSNEFKKYVRIWRKGLVSSQEILDISGLPPGPETGKLIEIVKRAQFAGIVTTRKGARALVERSVLPPK